MSVKKKAVKVAPRKATRAEVERAHDRWVRNGGPDAPVGTLPLAQVIEDEKSRKPVLNRDERRRRAKAQMEEHNRQAAQKRVLEERRAARDARAAAIAEECRQAVEGVIPAAVLDPVTAARAKHPAGKKLPR